MKNHSLPGSSLLTLVIIITLMSILCLNIWRTTMVSFDISLKKQLYEQQMQPIQALMVWGLEICKDNFDTIFNHLALQKRKMYFEIPHWMIHHMLYKATITIKEKNKNALELEAYLYCKNRIVSTARCIVTKTIDHDKALYTVNEWDSKS